jgi:hypothetical protein
MEQSRTAPISTLHNVIWRQDPPEASEESLHARDNRPLKVERPPVREGVFESLPKDQGTCSMPLVRLVDSQEIIGTLIVAGDVCTREYTPVLVAGEISAPEASLNVGLSESPQRFMGGASQPVR